MSDWRDGAECRDIEDPELFFPVGRTPPALAQIERAKAVCHQCDVRATCLKWAIDNRQDSGVWGGLDEEERHKYRRREQRKAARRKGALDMLEQTGDITLAARIAGVSENTVRRWARDAA